MRRTLIAQALPAHRRSRASPRGEARSKPSPSRGSPFTACAAR